MPFKQHKVVSRTFEDGTVEEKIAVRYVPDNPQTVYRGEPPMPQIPFWLQFARRGWESIKSQTDQKARALGVKTYSECPDVYRFQGWGLVGLSLACNVIYRPGDGPFEKDFGRIVA